MAVTIAVSNQKGGVGKTTTAIHLAAGLALAGKRTLLIDLDSQANATTGLGVAEASENRPGAYHAMVGDGPASPDWCAHSVMDGLSVLPASLHLAGVDLEIGEEADSTMRLARTVEALADDFDWIVVDCPPSLGVLSVNALAAADHVLTPLPPERFAMDGLNRLQSTMRRLRETGRIKVEAPIILLNRTQPWSEGHIARSIAIRNEAGERVLVAEASLAPALEVASDNRRPVFMEPAGNQAGDAFLHVAAEIICRANGDKFGAEDVFALVADMQAEAARRYPRVDSSGKGDLNAPIPRPASRIDRLLSALRLRRMSPASSRRQA